MTIQLNYGNLFHYLIDIGICQAEDLDSLTVNAGSKPYHWAMELPKNQGKLLIKQTPRYGALYNDVRVYKEWRFYQFLQANQDLDDVASLTPNVLHFDQCNSILLYICPEDYITLTHAYENQENLPIALATLLGTTLATLHSATASSPESHRFMSELEAGNLNYQLPYPDYLSDALISCLEPESLKKTPAQAWRFIGIVQQSEALRDVVTELVLNHRHCCLTHNTIHFNKILIPRQWQRLLVETQEFDHSSLKLIDWEACSWGDPACDLGNAILGYFLFWINSMIVHPAIEIKHSIQLATVPLDVVRPSMVAMTNSYISTYPTILADDPEFLKRAIQFAGLGLIYQLLAEFPHQPETALSHQNLYFYIAAQLLCRPEMFLSV